MSTSEPWVALLDGPATAKQLGVSQARVRTALKKEILKVQTKNGKDVTVRQTDDEGKFTRGRPSRVYMLTDKGRKRVKRAIKDAEQAQNDAPAPEQSEAVAA